jgi:acetylornithine deacetylase/succinyl-diaminopimelate desuccinylase-like protein
MLTMQPVFEYLEKNQPRFLNELCEYLRFPSVSAQSHHKADLEACGKWLVQHCQNIGLDAQLCPTEGHPVVLAKTPPANARNGRRPHFVVYGHYDVQPPEPFELWKSPPFEPRVAGHALFARGACDNKGQNFAHLKAIEAYLKTGTDLPCDLTFIIEGEEEVGSKSLSSFLKQHQAELACDAIVISDTGMPSKQHPALTYALRGIIALEVTLHGPNRDLHSGIFGGTVDNPAMVLCQMLGQLRDRRGRIAIPGFYDDVRPLSAYERKEFKRLPFKESEYRKLLGVSQLFGERGYTPIEQRSARPTLEINGLTSGYQGEGSKTIIPAWARAKLTLRLVPDQKPARIISLVRSHLKKICPRTVRLEIQGGHGAVPYLVPPTSAHAQAALRALEAAFGRKPVLLREGGSIPIVNEFKRVLKADALMLGLALPDDNAHSPNEKFDLECFAAGQRMSAYLWQELSKT